MVLVIDFRFAALTSKVSGGTAVFDVCLTLSKTGWQHVAGPTGPRTFEAVAARRASLSDALDFVSFVPSRKCSRGNVMQSETHHNGIRSFRKRH